MMEQRRQARWLRVFVIAAVAVAAAMMSNDRVGMSVDELRIGASSDGCQDNFCCVCGEMSGSGMNLKEGLCSKYLAPPVTER